MRMHLLTAPALGLALVLAGCGGGSDGPSKADYVAKADAICQKGGDASSKKLDAAVAALGTTTPTPEQLGRIVTTMLIPGIESEVKMLRALEKPKADTDAINGIYDALDAAIAKGRTDPAALVGNGSSSPFADANAKAKAYGLKVCGKS